MPDQESPAPSASAAFPAGWADPCAALVRSLPDLAWLKGSDGRYLAANEGFHRWVGAACVVGRSDAELFSEPLPSKYRSQELRVVREGIETRGEVELGRSDGPAVRLAVTRSPFRDAGGTVVGILGTARPLSATEESLIALGEKLARASHELSNPLNTILGFAQLLQLDARSDDDAEALRTVQREAERAGEGVARLRKLARESAGALLAFPEARADEHGSRGGARRVLVVDDEESIRSSIKRFLELRGHRVDAARDGVEALALLEEPSGSPAYDVILSDLRMPGLCGEQLLKRLRQRADGMDRRVVFMTGDATGLAEGTSGSAVPALLKPVNLEEIARVVEGRSVRSAHPA